MPDYRQCPTCGQLNRELARFCRECGSSLGSSSQKESSGRTASNVTGPLVHEDNRTRSTDDVAQPGPRGPRRRLPVALLALTLFAAVLALAGWQTGWPPAVFGARHVTAPRAARSASPPPSQVADSTASSSLPSPSPSASGIPATSHSAGPAATIRAYFNAISNQDYAKAWRLGGSNFSASFGAYVAGFAGTASDVVTILSVSGGVVTARLIASQTDGSTKTYAGTYTVANGVIIKSDVNQVH